MIAAIYFDFPLGWQAGLPFALAVLVLAAWLQRRRGLSGQRVAILTALRGTALLALLFLCPKRIFHVVRDCRAIRWILSGVERSALAASQA